MKNDINILNNKCLFEKLFNAIFWMNCTHIMMKEKNKQNKKHFFLRIRIFFFLIIFYFSHCCRISFIFIWQMIVDVQQPACCVFRLVIQPDAGRNQNGWWSSMKQNQQCELLLTNIIFFLILCTCILDVSIIKLSSGVKYVFREEKAYKSNESIESNGQ